MSVSVKDKVAEIQKDYEEGKLTREAYKDLVAEAEGRPSYTGTKKLQQKVDKLSRLEALEKELLLLRKDIGGV